MQHRNVNKYFSRTKSYFLKNSFAKTLANFGSQLLQEKSTIMNELSAADSIAGHVAFSFADLQVDKNFVLISLQPVDGPITRLTCR